MVVNNPLIRPYFVAHMAVSQLEAVNEVLRDASQPLTAGPASNLSLQPLMEEMETPTTATVTKKTGVIKWDLGSTPHPGCQWQMKV